MTVPTLTVLCPSSGEESKHSGHQMYRTIPPMLHALSWPLFGHLLIVYHWMRNPIKRLYDWSLISNRRGRHRFKPPILSTPVDPAQEPKELLPDRGIGDVR